MSLDMIYLTMLLKWLIFILVMVVSTGLDKNQPVFAVRIITLLTAEASLVKHASATLNGGETVIESVGRC